MTQKPQDPFTLLDNGAEQILYHSEFLTEAPLLCFESEFWSGQNKVIGSAQGRGTTWFVQGEKLAMALRHYRRGGLFGKLVADSYWFTGWQNSRSVAELRLLQLLSAGGVNVPRGIAARTQRTGLTYHADILVEKVAGAKDLVGLLQQSAITGDLWASIGQMIKKMHLLEVCHTDLNAHNILIDQAQQVWLIDFDKCYQKRGHNWQGGNLARLQRSFIKERGKRQIHFNDENWQALLKGYHDGVR
ncbi:3-deoxy-D-manno-octulosonic acid kinase [Motilimonas pumila]|uniref:3-deoxy-D-manno-octulosonic acid kinase n=1 Tax=Motilimonas pumila TaxID=2303987 RepID=A0A418YHI0_9GAMM|nr:3-deoxy-D-manno-octulosonic acid kinase [Motilimonas pumila]RJG49551.1 3-deoxy-D-manno-octulosonic acid kinase [Motilimonas pumila]